MTAGPPAELACWVEAELAGPAPDPAHRLAGTIRGRLGPATAAVLFYGSCLRRQTSEGVLDFYAIVDAYGSAYSSWLLALANAALPPNVFYVEVGSGEATLRAKYAVVSRRDFARGVGPASLRTGTWARFCQPARLLYARDDQARREVVEACVQAQLTALASTVPLLPDPGPHGFEALWQHVFRLTYAGEMRPEVPGTVECLYRADAARYERVARAGLAELAARDGLPVELGQTDFRLRLPAGRRRRARLAWQLRRPLAKLAYAAQLLKSALTFGDWLPYALWKLERHTGTHIEPSERQRRHPLVWGWPILWRVLWRRELR